MYTAGRSPEHQLGHLPFSCRLPPGLGGTLTSAYSRGVPERTRSTETLVALKVHHEHLQHGVVRAAEEGGDETEAKPQEAYRPARRS